MELKLKIEPNQKLLELFGPADSHLRALRKNLNVKISARKNVLLISGSENNVKKTAKIIEKMQKQLTKKPL